MKIMNEHKYIITGRYSNNENETIIRNYSNKLSVNQLNEELHDIWDCNDIENSTEVYIVSIVMVWVENNELQSQILDSRDGIKYFFEVIKWAK